MSKSNYPLRLQRSLLDEVRRVAAKERASINQFINVAVAEKLSALRTGDYFREGAERADVPAALALSRQPVRHERSRPRPYTDAAPPGAPVYARENRPGSGAPALRCLAKKVQIQGRKLSKVDARLAPLLPTSRPDEALLNDACARFRRGGSEPRRRRYEQR